MPASSMSALPIAQSSTVKVDAEKPAAPGRASTVDELWAAMNKPIRSQPSKTGRSSANRRKPKVDPLLAGVLGISAPPTAQRKAAKAQKAKSTGGTVDASLANWLATGGENGGGGGRKDDAAPGEKQVKIKRLEDLEEEARRAEAETAKEETRKKDARKTGLEGVLGAIRGEKKASVMDKTRKAWDVVKESDADVADELDAYKKDKNRYTEKVAFLERTDRREWEVDMAKKSKR